MYRYILLSFFCFPVFYPAFAQPIDYKGFPEWSWHQQDSTEYYLYTPGNPVPGKKIPVVLFLHGCCGVDNHATLRNCVDPPVRMWHQYGANRQSEPTFIIAPATSRGWRQHFADLKKVMDDLVANKHGDPQRIYVCGFSMGGEGSFQIIHEYPNYFAAAIMMGMSMRGDLEPVKNIPLWVNQGETDWFSHDLKKQVAAMRQLNGHVTDTGSTRVTGVNPRYSNFAGVDHPVQWHAAFTQDLTGWAYQKRNDGNAYPNVYFETPSYRQTVSPGTTVNALVNASDADGSIARIEFWVNGKRQSTATKVPYRFSFTVTPGDNQIEARAYDDKGKSSSAFSRIRTNIKPAIITRNLPTGFAGQEYFIKLSANGNGNLLFTDAGGRLPEGLLLFADGTLRGVPLETGLFAFDVQLADEDRETVIQSFQVKIAPQKEGDILVTQARNQFGLPCRISIMKLGETPNFNSRDSLTPLLPDEINFSNIGKYQGLPLIKTDINDTACKGSGCLSFNIDQDAILYIAYEKLDNRFTSSIPDWLKEYHREPGEIVAQYRYYQVFSRPVSKGHIILPGADARSHGVGTNYFVMLGRRTK